jgi:predicted ATPase
MTLLGHSSAVIVGQMATTNVKHAPAVIADAKTASSPKNGVSSHNPDQELIITRMILKNWRNFKHVDVRLGNRVFIVGPNASGKSNLLEVFRFLRDIARPTGGLQSALSALGGLRKVRCLAARKKPDVEIEIHLGKPSDIEPQWRYQIGLTQRPGDKGPPYLRYERIFSRDGFSKIRPDSDDKSDPERLTQTLLEQKFANVDFREISRLLERVTYLHLVPQLVRHAEEFSGPKFIGDPFGLQFMKRLSETAPRHRTEMLKNIEKGLKVAVPHFKELRYVEDKQGHPHVEVVYDHWRAAGARQREDQFSDGTIRLLGLFWALLESEGLLLLEEPELSLNNDIIRQIPALMHKLNSLLRRQIIVTTHSYALLSDKGIGLEEVLVLKPNPDGTIVSPADKMADVRALVEGGMKVGEAVLPLTNPEDVLQMSFL